MTDHTYRTARARVAALSRHRPASDPELVAARRALAAESTTPPTYAQLRRQGLSPHAIETLTLARDLMSIDPERVARFLRNSQAVAPVEVADVWPGGTPVHWDEDDEEAAWDDDEDPSPMHQWEYTTGAGWIEKNAAVMRVVAGIESGGGVMTIEWEDPPVNPKSSMFTPDVIAALKSRPGQWACIARSHSNGTTNHGYTKRHPEFETRSVRHPDRTFDLYARYIGSGGGAMTSTTDRTHWVAEGTRPQGQPGTVDLHRGQPVGWSYPAVLDADGTVWFWRDGRWGRTSPGLATTFTPGPEWQAQCTHLHHGVPHIVCATEAECTSLLRGESRDD